MMVAWRWSDRCRYPQVPSQAADGLERDRAALVDHDSPGHEIVSCVRRLIMLFGRRNGDPASGLPNFTVADSFRFGAIVPATPSPEVDADALAESALLIGDGPTAE